MTATEVVTIVLYVLADGKPRAVNAIRADAKKLGHELTVWQINLARSTLSKAGSIEVAAGCAGTTMDGSLQRAYRLVVRLKNPKARTSQ